MISQRNYIYLSLIFIVVFMTIQTIAQPDFLYNFCQDHILGNNYSTKTYQANLNHLLSTITSSNTTNIDHSGFYNSSYGQNSDQVGAIGLCRGDVKPEACRSCLNDSTYQLTELCPNRREAIGWYDNCMLRYSNRSIFQRMDYYPRFRMRNSQNVSADYVDGFNEVLMTLLADLKNKAAAGGSLRKYATGNAIAPNFKTIYGLAQCTPDLSSRQCNRCLDSAIADIPKCCDRREGGRVLTPSCNFRYAVSLFYEPTSDAPPPSPRTSLQSPPPTSIINNIIPTQGIL